MDFVTNIASDLHLDPPVDNTQLEGPIVDLLYKSKWEPLILAGDTLNILRNGKEAFRETIRLMSELAGPDGNVMLLRGNHDPIDDLVWLVKNYSCNHSLVASDCMVVPIRDSYIFITHGHQWCPQWGWGLDIVAQPLLNLMMAISPAAWNWVATKHGWAGPATNESQYHAVVLSVWAHGLRYASKNDCRVIVGHTHKLGGVVELYPYGIDYILANPAPLSTGSYIQVTDHIEVKQVATN